MKFWFRRTTEDDVTAKGVLGFESPTRGWVGRSAGGRQKKNMEPPTKLS